jgi:hypothetical protein
MGIFDFLFQGSPVKPLDPMAPIKDVGAMKESGLSPEEYGWTKVKQSASKALLAASSFIPAVGGIGVAALTGSALLQVGSTVLGGEAEAKLGEKSPSEQTETGGQGPNQPEPQIIYIQDQTAAQTPTDTMSQMFGPMMMMMMMMMMPGILGGSRDRSDSSSRDVDVYD